MSGREGRLIPTGATLLERGDDLIVFGPRARVDELRLEREAQGLPRP